MFCDRGLPRMTDLPPSPSVPHSKAANPDRVYAGVVQQNNAGDVDCLYDYCEKIKEERGIGPDASAADPNLRITQNCPHADQVKMLRVQAEDAKGPTYGRYLGSYLVGDEEFCMQIDAHMDFEDHWDKQLLDMWGTCPPLFHTFDRPCSTLSEPIFFSLRAQDLRTTSTACSPPTCPTWTSST